MGILGGIALSKLAKAKGIEIFKKKKAASVKEVESKSKANVKPSSSSEPDKELNTAEAIRRRRKDKRSSIGSAVSAGLKKSSLLKRSQKNA